MNFRFLHFIYGLIILVMLYSCARRGRPIGGEKDIDALSRELLEEINIQIKDAKLMETISFDYSDKHTIDDYNSGSYWYKDYIVDEVFYLLHPFCTRDYFFDLRITPSCAVLATSRPLRSKNLPNTKPRSLVADGLSI